MCNAHYAILLSGNRNVGKYILVTSTARRVSLHVFTSWVCTDTREGICRVQGQSEWGLSSGCHIKTGDSTDCQTILHEAPGTSVVKRVYSTVHTRSTLSYMFTGMVIGGSLELLQFLPPPYGAKHVKPASLLAPVTNVHFEPIIKSSIIKGN